MGAVLGLFLIACFVVPGLAMLLFPNRTFITASKPRWLGVPFLAVGAVVLYGVWPLVKSLLGMDARP